MAVTNTKATLASRLKEVYPEGITQLVPAKAELMKRLKFRKDAQPGKKAVFDIQLDHEQGFTTGSGDLTLNAAVAQNSKKCEVEGQGIYLRSRVSYDLIASARTSKQAFAHFNDSKFVPMVESFRKMEEILAIDGGRGLGVVASVSGQVITLTEGSMNAYRWLGAKGRVLEAFTALSGGSQHNGDITVVSINIATRQLTVSGTINAVDANDILFLKGARGAEPIGLMGIAKNNTTLYNIDASTEPLWKANHYDVGTSSLTLGKILEAAALSADKGCDTELTCLVPVRAFQALVSDEAALRQYGANYSSKEAKNGFEKLVFAGATGDIEVLPYMPIRDGEFVMFPEKLTSRIGCQDAVSENGKDGDIIFDVENSTSKEMRLWSNWSVFCERPGYVTYGTRSDGKALHA
jgi:hypothetical protein